MNRDLELLLAFLRPIHALLVDDSITEIMGNPDGSWWYERGGRVERADAIRFDAKSLHTGLEVIANRIGRKLDTSHPILNVQYRTAAALRRCCLRSCVPHRPSLYESSPPCGTR